MSKKRTIELSYDLLTDHVATLLYSMRLVDENHHDIHNMVIKVPANKEKPVVISFETKPAS